MGRTSASKAGRLIRFAGIICLCAVTCLLLGVYIVGWLKLSNKEFFDFLTLRPTVGCNLTDDMILVPGIKQKTFYIDCGGGGKLHCMLFRVPHSDTLTIVNHGNAGNIANRIHIADAVTKAGSSTLLYDYRGYGLSHGVPSIEGILADGLTVYDYAHDKLHYSPEHIFLYGESIGSGVTCYVANHRKCRAVILQSGIASIPAVAKRFFAVLNLYPDFVFPEPHLDNVAAVRTIHVPILIMSGQIDDTVRVQNSEQLYANANQPKQLVVLPHSGHNNINDNDPELFQDSVAKFVADHK